MKDKYFIDTNIFVYAFDKDNSEKNIKANQLIKEALCDKKGCISYQVIQEFINVSTRKFSAPLSIDDCEIYLERILFPLCEVFANLELYHHTLDIMKRWQYSFYDSLIIASALRAHCEILYSDDLQHNQNIESLIILNPFIEC